MKISQDIRDAAKAAEAEAGMAEMSQKFRDGGGQIEVAIAKG
jgi:phosphomethylpyrimidine synthase